MAVNQTSGLAQRNQFPREEEPQAALLLPIGNSIVVGAVRLPLGTAVFLRDVIHIRLRRPAGR
jgi:hypothetical protein